jgi:hypothetical protein
MVYRSQPQDHQRSEFPLHMKAGCGLGSGPSLYTMALLSEDMMAWYRHLPLLSTLLVKSLSE